DGPPPFVVPPDDDVDVEEEETAPFGEPLSHDCCAPLDALKLPCVSRSPSPLSPIPNGTRHNDGEEEDNGFDTPPPMETLKDVSLASPGGGIESFLEREAIRSDDLPVHRIGLSPPVSRDPSPRPERREEESLPNGIDHVEPPREAQPVDRLAPPEVDQASPADSIDNGDEDDDFGDFGFAPPPPPVDHQARKDLSTVTEEEDDWAAFQSSSAVSERKESVAVDDSDDWAAFEAAAPAAERQPSLDDDDDWVTDFASAPPPAAAAAPAAQPDVEVPTLPSLAELLIDEGIWSAEGTVEDEDDGLAFDLYARLDAQDPRSVKGGDEDGELLVSASLWLALRVVEEAAALRHTWEGSTTARQLYDLLHINATRPMQRAQLAAAAAPSPDAVLQPTRVGEMNGKSAARAVTLSTSNTSAYTTTSASSTSAAGTTTSASTSLGSGCLVPSTSSQSVSPASRSPTTDAFIVPPVDFDGEKFNLKTPAMQFDMDYFSGAGGGPPKIISSDSTLQRDLDAFGLSATSASKGMPRVESTPSVLDTILSSARAGANSAPRYLAPAELSLDARALHDALPSLDHLAASWIAFPVRDNGDS
ncbi:hypothetical protein PENTCL1PPCAC_600, partial [Pristionchus entomophagus]